MYYLKLLKPKLFLLLCVLLLFSSCLVNSLFPFYTQDTIYFEKAIVGTWVEYDMHRKPQLIGANGISIPDTTFIWSFKPVYNLDGKEYFHDDGTPWENPEKKWKEHFAGGYIANYKEINQYDNFKENIIKANNDTIDTGSNLRGEYIAMPFKINNQLFLDFTPLHAFSQQQNLNYNFLDLQTIETHILAKVDVISENRIDISWFPQNKVDSLIKQGKLKIKHEKYGVNDFFDASLLLTAPTEELQSFIKKYMNSNVKNKWETNHNFSLQKYPKT